MLEGLIERTRDEGRRREYEIELRCPPFPMLLLRVWSAYRRLRARKKNGLAISAIEWPDIDAFRRIAGIALSPWEVEMIEMLDDIYLVEMGRTDNSDE